MKVKKLLFERLIGGNYIARTWMGVYYISFIGTWEYCDGGSGSLAVMCKGTAPTIQDAMDRCNHHNVENANRFIAHYMEDDNVQ
jgi:hypothetical protein